MRKTYIGTTLINDIYVGLDKSTMPVLETIGVDYVIAAGGGGGGASGGGGGGGEVATNYITGSQLSLINTVIYEIVVGDGGAHGDPSTAGGQPNPGAGSNGEDSYIAISSGSEVLRAIGGGGGGGTYWNVSRSNLVTSEKNGRDGGSGGGGAITNGVGGSATGSISGNDGGNNSIAFMANEICSTLTSSLTPDSLASANSAGGGGQSVPTSYNAGAFYGTLGFSGGSDGGIWFKCDEDNPNVNDDQWANGGQGGNAISIPWIKNGPTALGAGGGGGETVTQRVGAVETQGLGGKGGTNAGNGGGGGQSPFGGGDATANSGAGGGGGGLSNTGTSSDYYETTQGGDGGSGIIAIRYPEPQRFTGGDVLVEDGYVYHTFLSSSILTPIV